MSVNVQFIQNFHMKIVQVSRRIFLVDFPPASRQESPDAARRRKCPPNGPRSLARSQHRASLQRAVAPPSAFQIFPNFFRKIPRQCSAPGQPSGPCARPRFPRRSAASFPPPASPASPAQVSASVTASAASTAILRKFSGQHRRHKARQRARDPATISASASAPTCAPDFPGQHPTKVSSRASAQIFRRIFQRAANFPAQIFRAKKSGGSLPSLLVVTRRRSRRSDT